MHVHKKTAAAVYNQENEYFGYWSMADPGDVDTDIVDEKLKKMGIDPYDFQTRNELNV
jgi:hypothetical protein